MIKRLFFVFAWIVCVAVLHLFGNNAGTFAVLIASVVIPMLSGLVLVLASKAVCFRAELVLPESSPKGEMILGKLMVECGWLVYLFKISCNLVCANLFTGDKSQVVLSFNAIRRGKADISFELQTLHCGYLCIAAEDFLIADPLGLFARRLTYTAKRHVYVPPSGFAANIRLSLDVNLAADHDEYSTTQPGMDVSELYGVREYVPGDPIKSIHWKLTEKLDKVMVREFGLPVAKPVLLLFESVLLPGAHISAAGWDASAEMFYSVGLALLKECTHIHMGWYSTETKDLVSRELCTKEDALGAMRECLSSVYNKGRLPQNEASGDTARSYGPDVAPKIDSSRSFNDESEFNHVVVIIPSDTPRVGLLENGEIRGLAL